MAETPQKLTRKRKKKRVENDEKLMQSQKAKGIEDSKECGLNGGPTRSQKAGIEDSKELGLNGGPTRSQKATGIEEFDDGWTDASLKRAVAASLAADQNQKPQKQQKRQPAAHERLLRVLRSMDDIVEEDIVEEGSDSDRIMASWTYEEGNEGYEGQGC